VISQYLIVPSYYSTFVPHKFTKVHHHPQKIKHNFHASQKDRFVMHQSEELKENCHYNSSSYCVGNR
jgi:hypothetical protein